ncbi:MAG: FHA domain-containing protein, partial [Acidobacteriia bacterium]|nr:FHA domain-containing protein [Terriglobia bacterium]
MPEESVTASRSKAWLVLRTGAQAGARYPLQDGVTRVGRDPENEIVVQGADAAVVSQRHAEIVKGDSGYRIRDLGSTNGTYVDGERIGEAELRPQSVVQLGKSGQEFAFVVTDAAISDLNSTLVLPEGIHTEQMRAPEPALEGHEALLNEAVTRARRARAEGAGGQTMTIMRDALKHAVRRSSRRLRFLSAGLAAALVLLSGYGYWRIVQLRRDKATIDSRIQAIEKRLDAAEDPAQMGPLLSQLAAYQNQGASLQRNVLYRLSVHEPPGVREIRSLMAEFGAEVYSIPPEFAERVNHYIRQYQGPDRPLMAAALSRYKERIEVMRKILEQQELPPDMAYIPLV